MKETAVGSVPVYGGLSPALRPLRVVAGLVPAIHAATQPLISQVLRSGAAWMAGTSPAMTEEATLGAPRTMGAAKTSTRSPSPLAGEGGPKGRMRGRAGLSDWRSKGASFPSPPVHPSSGRLRRPPSPARGEGARARAGAS